MSFEIPTNPLHQIVAKRKRAQWRGSAFFIICTEKIQSRSDPTCAGAFWRKWVYDKVDSRAKDPLLVKGLLSALVTSVRGIPKGEPLGAFSSLWGGPKGLPRRHEALSIN